MTKSEKDIVVPTPTYIYRILHIDNLMGCLGRSALYAPNNTPTDSFSYKPIHNVEVQKRRQEIKIACGPGGVIHDYVAFYFGRLSPMLFQLNTGRVEGYTEGQAAVIYLVSTVQTVTKGSVRFVFSDGHGVAAYTHWYEALGELDKIDWGIVNARYWSDPPEDGDRQRRKQAEFLVYQKFPWELIQSIGVFNEKIKCQVEEILANTSLNSG